MTTHDEDDATAISLDEIEEIAVATCALFDSLARVETLIAARDTTAKSRLARTRFVAFMVGE